VAAPTGCGVVERDELTEVGHTALAGMLHVPPSRSRAVVRRSSSMRARSAKPPSVIAVQRRAEDSTPEPSDSRDPELRST